MIVVEKCEYKKSWLLFKAISCHGSKFRVLSSTGLTVASNRFNDYHSLKYSFVTASLVGALTDLNQSASNSYNIVTNEVITVSTI
jgi:hypothetical protein